MVAEIAAADGYSLTAKVTWEFSPARSPTHTWRSFSMPARALIRAFTLVIAAT